MTDHLDIPFLDFSDALGIDTGAGIEPSDVPPVTVPPESASTMEAVADAISATLDLADAEPSTEFLAFADSIGQMPSGNTAQTRSVSALRSDSPEPFPELFQHFLQEEPVETDVPSVSGGIVPRTESAYASVPSSQMPDATPLAYDNAIPPISVPSISPIQQLAAIESDFPPAILSRLTELAAESSHERSHLAIRGTARAMLYIIEELDVFFDMDQVWREKQRDFRQKLQGCETTEYERWGGIFFRARKRPISQEELEERVHEEFDRKYREYRSSMISRLHFDAETEPSPERPRRIARLRLKHMEELEFLLEFYSHKLRLLKRERAERSAVPMTDEERQELVSKIESIREEFDREFAEQMGRSEWRYRDLEEFDRKNCHVSSGKPRRK